VRDRERPTSGTSQPSYGSETGMNLEETLEKIVELAREELHIVHKHSAGDRE
jgi:hypothetical protein